MFKNVDRYTRASVNGKWIKCPKCSQTSKVFHFSWSALVCQCCRESINKTDFLVEVN
jgi:ribosomal protein S27E